MVNRIRSTKGGERRSLILLPLSAACFLIAMIMIIVDPIQLIANYRTRLAQGSEIIEILKQKDAPSVLVSAYLFNVTNAESFLAGEDNKLKVEEVGPFTYLEQRTNVGLQLDEEAGVMRYTPRSKVKFLPDESIADPRDINVTMPNVAMLGMSSMMMSHPYVTKLGFSVLLSHLQTKAIVPLTAYEFLWGYEEPLISLGNTFLPGWITFKTLGMLDRLYDNTVEYNLELGISGSEKFSIKSMNGVSGLPAWEYGDIEKRTSCNTFTNVFEGIAYPSQLPPGSPIRLFRNVLCRFYELEYQGTVDLENSIKALSYKLSNKTFNINNDTECLCSRGLCMEGISDLSPCFYKMPFALSNAHFMHGDPKLFERIEGLKPDEEKHGSAFLIDTHIGMALKTEFSVQVNVVVKHVDFNRQAGRFADMVVPVCYLKLTQPELTEQNRKALKLLYVIGPSITCAIIIGLFIAGALMLSYSIYICLVNCLHSKQIVIHIPNQEKPLNKAPDAPLLES